MKTEVVQMSPKMATDLLRKNVKNRILNRHKVNEFISVISKGEWKLTHQGICFSITDKLIDGQHRLTAIAEGKTSVPIMVVKGLPEDIMTVIDRGKVRSVGDSFALLEVVNATNIAAAIALHDRFATNGYAGENPSNAGRGSFTKSIDEMYAFYIKNQTVIDKCHQLSMKCYQAQRLFTTSQIAGLAMFLIIDNKEQFSTVSEFWLQVHNISEQSQSQAPKILHNTLIKYLTGSEKMKMRYKLAITIKAWNLYKSGGQVKILKYDERETFPSFN